MCARQGIRYLAMKRLSQREPLSVRLALLFLVLFTLWAFLAKVNTGSCKYIKVRNVSTLVTLITWYMWRTCVSVGKNQINKIANEYY